MGIVGHGKKLPYRATVELQMSFNEQRYWKNNKPLIVTRGKGSSVPVAICRAIRLAFKHPNVKRKAPTWIEVRIKGDFALASRWRANFPNSMT